MGTKVVDLIALSLGADTFRRRAALGAFALATCLTVASARAASIDVLCEGLPQSLAAELDARVHTVLENAGMAGSTLRLECSPSGVWVIWFDGSRMLVDQTPGFVPGVVATVEGRLSQRPAPAPDAATSAAPTADSVPQGAATAAVATDHEIPPADDMLPGADMAPESPRSSQDLGSEGGVGLAMMTELWSGTGMGIGPRLDISLALPGQFALLLGEGTLFGVGSASSSQMLIFDFQAGVAFGAPFRTRKGLGAVLLLGAERMTASSVRSGLNGVWKWTALVDLGLRGSLTLSSVNFWLGADALLRSSDFQTGGPGPVDISATAALLSIGCFLPAFTRGLPPQ